MDSDAVEAVEKILKYSFVNKSLLKEAITQTSCSCVESSALFERLEFLGDSVLEVALTNYLHLAYPNLKPIELNHLRMANVSNEKFARVAVNNNLHQFLILEDPNPQLDKRIKKFSEAVSKEDERCRYGVSEKPPKILADLVESIAGAVYIDVNFDMQRLWEIFRDLLEPLYTLDDLWQHPRLSFCRLSRLAREHGKQIKYMHSKDDSNKHIAEVYLDDKLLASGLANDKYSAKRFAFKEASQKLSECIAIEDVKRKLFEICSTVKLQLQTESSSLPTASENPLTHEITPTEMVIDEDSPHVEPEDVEGKSFEICSTEKLQSQSGSSSLPTVSANPLTYEMTIKQMVIDEDSPHVEPEDVKGKSFEICSTEKLQSQSGSSSLATVSANPLTYEMTIKQMVVDEDSLGTGPDNAKRKLIMICAKNKWPTPIFSVEEEREPKNEPEFVCSVKIEIPTVEGTFHMKGDAKSSKEQAEYSSAYHMIRALESSLMTLVISNLQKQESLDEKKNQQMEISLDENNNLHSKKRKRRR